MTVCMVQVAYVKTGSFDLVLNEASKRKSPNAVSFSEGERMVGDTANALVPLRTLCSQSSMARICGLLTLVLFCVAENTLPKSCDFPSAAAARSDGRRSHAEAGTKNTLFLPVRSLRGRK